MAFSNELKGFCFLQFTKCESVLTAQQRFCTKYQRKTPTNKAIYAWYNKLKATGCLRDATQTDRPVHQLNLSTKCEKHLPRAPENLCATQSVVANVTANCVAYSMQISLYETIPIAPVAGVESPGSQSSNPILCKFSRKATEK